MPYQTDELTGIRWTPCTNAGSAQIPGAAPVQVVGVTIVGQSAVYQVAEIGAGSYAAFNLRMAFNGPQPIDPGGYGSCTMGGAVQTLWDTGTPSPGDIWGIKPGQFSLTKGGVGSFVVDGIVDSGTKRMFGRWEGISTLLSKYAGSTVPLTPGNTDLFNVWYGAPGSEVVSAGPWTVTGAARFEPVDKTGFAWLQHDGGGWYAIESEHLATTIGGVLGGSLTAGGDVTGCSVAWYENGANPGSTAHVFSHESLFTGVTNTPYRAVLNRMDDKYYFEWVAC